MTQHPVRIAAAAEGGLVKLTLLEAIVKRYGYVLDIGESLSGLDFDVGSPPLCVLSVATGFNYFYDATDATTADDGVTCLVSGNGLRYHVEDSAALSLSAVLGTATVAPGSPTLGDAWIVGAAATGDFAGHDDDIAFRTRRGWVFAMPDLGMTVLDESTDTNTQFTATGWGTFAPALGDGSVTPEALAFPGGLVVEATLSTPPGSPSAGQWWIVGAAATGAWSGKEARLAGWDGAAYSYLTPAEGWTVWHKVFGYQVSYVSGAWVNAQISLLSGVLRGCELSNNALDATNDIDIAAGKVVDSTGAVIMAVPAITKRLDAAWAVGSGNGGRDTGAISNAWWHVWAIQRADTGVVDVLFSLSATAPTMPTSYTYAARLGAIYRTGGAIVAFAQRGDIFDWMVRSSDVAGAPGATTAQTATLLVPTGVIVDARIVVSLFDTNSNPVYALVTPLKVTDTTPAATAHDLVLNDNNAAEANSMGKDVETNTSGQVRYRCTSGSTTVYIQTRGWIDRRGKL